MRSGDPQPLVSPGVHGFIFYEQADHSWTLGGSVGLSWALLGDLGSPGLYWARLGSPGLSWLVWAFLGSPVLFWARLGSLAGRELYFRVWGARVV